MVDPTALDTLMQGVLRFQGLTLGIVLGTVAFECAVVLIHVLMLRRMLADSR